ncbi:MAG: DsbA family protein [Nitrospirales bacterium]
MIGWSRQVGLRFARRLVLVFLGLTVVAMIPLSTAGSAEFEGKYTTLEAPSTHAPGKVKMTEFVDFYCPHCHMFEQQVVPYLKQEFGDQLEITVVGYPIIPGKLPTPFEMYEQAKVMGKGEEMRHVLFRTIHRDRLPVLDRLIREILITEVGLDPAKFEAGLASGKPAQAVSQGKQLGDRMKVQSTPTVVFDGNIKPESMDPQNLKTIIQSILNRDRNRKG